VIQFNDLVRFASEWLVAAQGRNHKPAIGRPAFDLNASSTLRDRIAVTAISCLCDRFFGRINRTPTSAKAPLVWVPVSRVRDDKKKEVITA
jgi:hypothetical protein